MWREAKEGVITKKVHVRYGFFAWIKCITEESLYGGSALARVRYLLCTNNVMVFTVRGFVMFDGINAQQYETSSEYHLD